MWCIIYTVLISSKYSFSFNIMCASHFMAGNVKILLGQYGDMIDTD